MNDTVKDLISAFSSLVKGFIERVQELWNRIKTHVNNSMEIQETIVNRKQQYKLWHRSTKITKGISDQVLMRRPLMLRARSNC